MPVTVCNPDLPLWVIPSLIFSEQIQIAHQMTSEGTGEEGEGNQSWNLLAIWSNWLFAVFAGWEAEHILYGLSCYGGWSHPPILDPRCRSPWLRAPFPCLAFLWSPRGCTPPPPPWCAMQGGQPRVRFVWRTPGPHQGGRGPSPPPYQPHTSGEGGTPLGEVLTLYTPLPKRSFSWSTRDLVSYPEEEASSLPRGNFSAFLETSGTGSSLRGLI